MTNFLVFPVMGIFIGGIIGFVSIPFMLFVSIVIVIFTKKNYLASVLIGTLVFGAAVGWSAFLVNNEGIKIGILYGAFYGGSLTSYFASENKDISLWKAFFITILLIITIIFIGCGGSEYYSCFEILDDGLDQSLEGAVSTICLGLVLLLLVKFIIPTEEYFKKL